MIKDKLQKLFTRNRITVNYRDSINAINVRGKYKDNITLRKLIEYICNKNYIDSLFDIEDRLVIEINFNKIDQRDYDRQLKNFPLRKGLLYVYVGLETSKERIKRRNTDTYALLNYACYVHSKPTELYQRKCVNCGAPLSGHKCKFCDTEYYEM